MCCCAKSLQSCPTLRDPTDYSLPGSSVNKEQEYSGKNSGLPCPPPGDFPNPLDMYKFSSVTQLCPTLCDPMNRSTPGPPSITNSQSSLRLTSIELAMPSSHLMPCHPLFLLPPIPLSISVLSNESTLRMR